MAVEKKMANSSLSFEILLYLNAYYLGFLILAEIGIVMFKILHLPYPMGTLIVELLILAFLVGTEASRLFMGHKGNLTEKTFPLIVSIGLTVPSVLGVLYFFLWQTYVLRLELILFGIQIVLQSFELCFAIMCLLRFCKAGTY